MSSIGEKIYNLRKRKGISQEELADIVHVSRQTISRWESNSAQPSSANIKCICDYFEVTVNYFYDSDLAYSNELAIVKVNNESVKKSNKKSIIRLVIGLVFSIIVSIILGFFCVWFGSSVFSTNTGDVAEKTIKLTHPIFICVLIPFLIFLLLDIILTLLIILRCKSNVNHM